MLFGWPTQIDYLLASGDFREPETRIPFTDADLASLDACGRQLELGRPSVLQAKNSDAAVYAENNSRADLLAGVEGYLGEVCVEMMKLVEDPDLDPEEAQMQLVLSMFPTFASLYDQLCTVDAERARQHLWQLESYLVGPKNRPTTDASGLLPVILNFIGGLKTNRGDHLGGFGPTLW